MSFHHGGGVGIGYSLHAGMVVVADGTDTRPTRACSACSTSDPGMGVMRHADAGYPEAIEAAKRGGLDLPMVSRDRRRVLRGGIARAPYERRASA